MSANQCKNCDMRDTNNNYLSTNLNLIHNNNNNRGSGNTTHNTTGTINVTCTAKVMWGTVGAINELREKEQANKKKTTNPNRKDQS